MKKLEETVKVLTSADDRALVELSRALGEYKGASRSFRFVWPIAFCTGMIGYFTAQIIHDSGKDIHVVLPSQTKFEPGSVSSNRLTIDCKDLNGNGLSETILYVDKKPYLLKQIDSVAVLEKYLSEAKK